MIRILPFSGRFLLPAAALALAAAAAPGQGVPHDEAALALWNTPSFQRQFLGTYGVRAEVEPRVDELERKQMEKIAALLAEAEGLAGARELLEQSVQPTVSAVFDFTLANVYFQQELYDAAAEWYQSALEKFPSYQRAFKNLGLVHMRAGQPAKAIVPFTRAMELGGADGLSCGLLGYAYSGNEQFVEAETAYRQAMMLQPETPDWKLGLARCLFKQRKYEEAVALCDELIRKDPERPDYRLLQANAWLGLKQPLRAAEIYEYLDLTGRAQPASLSILGDIYANEGLMDLAADAYLRALGKDSEAKAERFLRNAEVLASRAAPDEARRLLVRLNERFGANLTAEERKRMLKLEARMAAAAGGGDAEQLRLLEEIVKLDPLDGEALILLGQLHARAGAIEKAVFQFERATGLEKFEADARLKHGQALVRAGRFQDALPLLKKAHELKPREDVARYIEQVERVARMRN